MRFLKLTGEIWKKKAYSRWAIVLWHFEYCNQICRYYRNKQTKEIKINTYNKNKLTPSRIVWRHWDKKRHRFNSNFKPISLAFICIQVSRATCGQVAFCVLYFFLVFRGLKQTKRTIQICNLVVCEGTGLGNLNWVCMFFIFAFVFLSLLVMHLILLLETWNGVCL